MGSGDAANSPAGLLFSALNNPLAGRQIRAPGEVGNGYQGGPEQDERSKVNPKPQGTRATLLCFTSQPSSCDIAAPARGCSASSGGSRPLFLLMSERRAPQAGASAGAAALPWILLSRLFPPRDAGWTGAQSLGDPSDGCPGR